MRKNETYAQNFTVIGVLNRKARNYPFIWYLSLSLCLFYPIVSGKDLLATDLQYSDPYLELTVHLLHQLSIDSGQCSRYWGKNN